MPYLGSEPGAITDAFTDTFTGDGSETAFTLTQASTTNSVFVRIHGVMQRNGTDFNVDGTTLTFTTAPPNASNNIVVQFFTVGSVQEVADNGITLAKLAHGTDGNLISYDTSGAPVAIATGNDGQVLTSAGAGAAPAFEAIPASGWAFVQEIAVSSSSTIDVEGFAAGYDYKVVAYALDPSTDGGDTRALFGTGATPTYQTSGYNWIASGGYTSTASTVSALGAAYAQLQHVSYGGAAAGEEILLNITIFNPGDSGNRTYAIHTNTGLAAAGTMNFFDGAFWRTTDEAVTALRIYPVTGNFTTGKVYVYRRPNA